MNQRLSLYCFKCFSVSLSCLHIPARHQVSLCGDDVLTAMSAHNVLGAMHATEKLFDNGVARENFMQKLKDAVMDNENGDISA